MSVQNEELLHEATTIEIVSRTVNPYSSTTGEGLPAVRAALAGRICVLVGHSGVGKSSLLNARLVIDTAHQRNTPWQWSGTTYHHGITSLSSGK